MERSCLSTNPWWTIIVNQSASVLRSAAFNTLINGAPPFQVFVSRGIQATEKANNIVQTAAASLLMNSLANRTAALQMVAEGKVGQTEKLRMIQCQTESYVTSQGIAQARKLPFLEPMRFYMQLLEGVPKYESQVEHQFLDSTVRMTLPHRGCCDTKSCNDFVSALKTDHGKFVQDSTRTPNWSNKDTL